MELFPTKKQAVLASIFNGQDSIYYLVATFYFWKICNKWTYFAVIGYCMEFVTAILIWFLPESPRVLVELNRYAEAEAALRRIAWWTNKQSEITSGMINSAVSEVQALS